MAFQITLKLKEGSPPHIYLEDLKKHMEGDQTLHPLMKKTLLLLKKTRMPYVRLAPRKEIVFATEDMMHFERILEPQLSGWSRMEWSKEECEDYIKNPKKYLKGVFDMYDKIGYEFYNKEDITDEKLEQLKKITIKQTEDFKKKRSK